MAFYLDTSAAVKLVVAERESSALRAWLRRHEGRVVSCDLLRTELLRATRRGAPNQMERARAVLDALTLLTVPTEIFERAATVEPTGLRSLDALHLSVALELGDDLEGLVAYDERLRVAAHQLGIRVVAPS